MSNKNLVTCPHCKKKLSKESAKKIGTRSYYHEECIEAKEQEEKEKKRESEDYRNLIEYICQIYNLDSPTGMILKQIKEYRESPFNYKLRGMKLALQYFYEIEDNNILEDSGIGIIPYVYEKARKHYLMKLDVEKSLEGYVPLETKSIEVDSPKNISPKNNIEYIDIVSL